MTEGFQLPAYFPELEAAKQEVDRWTFAVYGGVVQSGPFEGMKLLPEVSWKETRLAPLVLGCYEEELHGEVERQVRRLLKVQRPVVSVIGSAEGYYAIGFKLRVPSSTVYTVEPDEKANVICSDAAKLNGVTLVCGAPLDVVLPAADLLLLDCEGHEVAYLDVARFPCLAGKHILVEVHNLPGQATDEILLERFRGTHRVTAVFEGPRNPSKFSELCRLSSDYRYLAVSENRPCLMSWFILEPKGLALS